MREKGTRQNGMARRKHVPDIAECVSSSGEVKNSLECWEKNGEMKIKMIKIFRMGFLSLSLSIFRELRAHSVQSRGYGAIFISELKLKADIRCYKVLHKLHWIRTELKLYTNPFRSKNKWYCAIIINETVCIAAIVYPDDLKKKNQLQSIRSEFKTKYAMKEAFMMNLWLFNLSSIDRTNTNGKSNMMS